MAVIEKKKLPEKVIDEIRSRIETGRLKIGDKLPNQNQLSIELGVSRTSLREAMKILDLLNVIEQRPGYGTVIRNKIPELNAESHKLTLLSDEKATDELLMAREIIECGAVKLAAQKASEAQIQKIQDIVDQMETHLKNEDYQGYKKLDHAFHELITSFSGNRFLSDPSIALNRYMQQFINENIELLPGLVKESHRYHQSICEALSNRDPETAEREMRLHIRNLANTHKRFHSNARTGKSSEIRKRSQGTASAALPGT